MTNNPQTEDMERVKAVLFPKGTAFTEPDLQRLLEQYKLLVQTSESVVLRRQGVNTFFLTINTLLLSGIGLLAKQGLQGQFGAIGMMGISITGVILCSAWTRLVRSHRQLNAGKFAIINTIEKHLPASMFEAEWVALGEGKDDRKYQPFTKTEEATPVVFGVIYGLAACFGFLSLIGVRVL